MAKSKSIDALEFLPKPAAHAVASVCAVYGDDAFLKREVLTALRRQVLGTADGECSLAVFAGKDAQWRDVRDALATVSLFGGGRTLAVVEDADPFVTRHRGELEDYVVKPIGGILLLDVKSLPNNTRLAKAIAKNGLAIECKSPTEARAKRWLVSWAQREHGVKLQPSAADAVWELLPPQLGILQQEVAKLALLAGDAGEIDVALVRRHVGGWRTRTAWEMVDAVAAGQAQTALQQLDRLIAAGDEPIGLLAQMAGTLRRMAAATQIVESGDMTGRTVPLRAALQRAGIPPFKLSDAERQLRQIGRHRAKQLLDVLLHADLAMKSHNSTRQRARLELERLIVALSTAADDRKTARAASA